MFATIVFVTGTAQSRRERPAKPALSHQWIVAETIGIMRREGLEKATMRRVAQALDTGPASLYVYVANTAELHAAVLDELLGALPSPAEGTWQERAAALLRAYANVLFSYPGLARSALVLTPTGPNSLRLQDLLLGSLLDGGLDPRTAAWGANLLVQHVTGIAAEHAAPNGSDVDAPADPEAAWLALSAAVLGADKKRTPHLAAHVGAVLSGTGEDRFTWAIDALICGIAHTPAPPSQSS